MRSSDWNSRTPSVPGDNRNSGDELPYSPSGWTRGEDRDTLTHEALPSR